jgi:hypothetical protein
MKSGGVQQSKKIFWSVEHDLINCTIHRSCEESWHFDIKILKYYALKEKKVYSSQSYNNFASNFRR